MFTFEGDYRSKPRQLIGRHRKEDRDLLLHRAEASRREREEFRKKTEKAVKVQALIRRFLTRSRLRRQLIIDLENSKKTNSLNQNLLHFLRAADIYLLKSLSPDHLPAVVHLAQNALRQADQLAVQFTNDRTVAFSITKFLADALAFSATLDPFATSLINPILRMLEIFLNTERFPKDLLESLCVVLCKRRFFSSCLSVLAKRSAGMDLIPSSRAPTEFHSSLTSILTKPLIICLSGSNQKDQALIVARFCQEILSVHPPKVVSAYLLRALSDPRLNLLPALKFFQILPSVIRNGTLIPNLWLCKSLLSIIAGWSRILVENQVKEVMAVVDFALCGLNDPDHQSILSAEDITAETDEMDDDDDVDMDFHSSRNRIITVEEEETRVEIAGMMESSAFINAVLGSLNVNDPENVESGAGICFSLLRINDHDESTLGTLFYKFAFNMKFLKALWKLLSTFNIAQAFANVELRSFIFDFESNKRWIKMFAVFARLLLCTMGTVYDEDFTSGTDSAFDFKLEDIVQIAAIGRDVAAGLIYVAYSSAPQPNSDYPLLMSRLFSSLVNLIKELHDRNSRKAFCPDDFWTSPRLSVFATRMEKAGAISDCIPDIFEKRNPFKPTKTLPNFGMTASLDAIRFSLVLDQIPYLLPFYQRLRFVYMTIKAERMTRRDDFDFIRPGTHIDVKVRREYIYEDAFADLSREAAPDIKKPLRVSFQNLAGLDEAGVDGGGLFREFMNQTIRAGFDANRGLFRYNEERALYPNPEATVLFPSNYRDHFFFLGRILGKAIYENLLTEVHFADFFLKKLLSKSGKNNQGNVDLHYLKSLDSTLFKNLLSLKNFPGNVADLQLDFSVTVDEMGVTRTIDLKPNGRNIPVERETVMEYIFLMADFKLNRQIRQHTACFRDGLNDVIPIHLLQIFNFKELQTLISGNEEPIDVCDWRANTHYSEPFNEQHPTIQAFWKVVEAFDEETKGNLLKFVTSCSRPPLLGFKDLPHKFSINPVPEQDRLPTASTCMNLLKLPVITDEKRLRERLLYAIESGAGFELS